MTAALIPEQKWAQTVYLRGCGSAARVAKFDWLPDSVKKGRQEKTPPGDRDILYYITQYIRLYRLRPGGVEKEKRIKGIKRGIQNWF